MKDVQLDVNVELPHAEQDRLGDRFAFEVLELLRGKADELCHTSGARLRTDIPPEIVYRRGAHKLLGGDWIMIASRWHAWAPEDA